MVTCTVRSETTAFASIFRFCLTEIRRHLQCLVAANVVPPRGANSAPLNSFAGFKGKLGGVGKKGETEGR